MPTDLAAKLGYRGGPRLVVGAPAGYGLAVETAGPSADPPAFVQVFVTSAAALRDTVWPLLERAGPDPVVWVTYPKRGAGVATDLNRDVVAHTVEGETAFRVVSNVAVDTTWSALRLRRKTLVRPRS